MNDKRIEICENGGDVADSHEKRTMSQWGHNTIQPSDVVGFEPGNKKMKILQLFVGYSNEQIASENFQSQIEQDKKIFLQQLGTQYFDLGHINKSLNIGTTQKQRSAGLALNVKDLPEMARLASEIYQAYPDVDVVAIRVNPALADFSQMPGRRALGAAYPGLDAFVVTGPDLSGKYPYGDLHTASSMAHECSHVLSGFPKTAGIFPPMNGVDIADSYSYAKHSYSELASGRHSELTLAPNLESIPVYYPNGLTPQLADALKKVKPTIEDTGFQCTEKKRIGKDVVHPVYTYNAGPDMMEQAFTNAQLLSGTQMPTPLQKALINGIASEYLKKEGRLPESNATAPETSVQASIVSGVPKSKNHTPVR